MANPNDEYFHGYQNANTVAFFVEHLATYSRTIKATIGYEIDPSEHKMKISAMHVLMHLYMGMFCTKSIFVNTALFILNTQGSLPEFGNDAVDSIVKCSAKFVKGLVSYPIFLTFANPVDPGTSGKENALTRIFALAAMDLVHCATGNKISGIFATIAKMFSVPIQDATSTSIFVKAGTFFMESVYNIEDYRAEYLEVNTTGEALDSCAWLD